VEARGEGTHDHGTALLRALTYSALQQPSAPSTSRRRRTEGGGAAGRDNWRARLTLGATDCGEERPAYHQTVAPIVRRRGELLAAEQLPSAKSSFNLQLLCVPRALLHRMCAALEILDHTALRVPYTCIHTCQD